MEKVGNPETVAISVSVVSHGQLGLVTHLLQDMQAHCCGRGIELILTLNTDEDVVLDVQQFGFPIRIIKNATPKGFGANHNQAFLAATGRYFFVVNPDIRFDSCPFSDLLAGLNADSIGIVAPLVLAPGLDGRVEDSARRFPTPLKIFGKLLGKSKVSDYRFQLAPQAVDWVGGMFMLFERQLFAQLHGFDEAYFLYYEDVDICARASLLGLQIVVCPQVRVIHHAQRSSHRQLKYLVWHLRSMVRFFLSPVYWQLKRLHRL